MACYHPIECFRKPGGGVMFTPLFPGSKLGAIKIACGQCIGCRLDRSRSWAVRCVHEAQMHEKNSFITLTFNDANVPADRSLDKSVFQKFMKRLRKAVSPLKIRFYMCGEYGEASARPHYHACIFGYDFRDRQLWSVRDGVRLYVSEQLNRLWPYGYATVGDVTFESAAYVARYILKKVTGSSAEEHYGGRLPEYTSMSLKPGIGAMWFEKYHSDVYPADSVVSRGHEVRPPKYYDVLYERLYREEFEVIKAKRQEFIWQMPELTQERLEVKEKVKVRQIERLVRDSV